MKVPQTLYLVASEHAFRLVRTQGAGLADILARSAGDFPDVAFRHAAEKAHGHTGPGGVSFDVNGPAKKDEEERNRLAMHGVAALEAEWDRGGHDRIVLVAGPKMLGALRDAMPKALKPHIAAELHKDLAKVALHDLPAHLAEVPGA